MFFETYQSIKSWKDEQIASNLTDVLQLNQFHDSVMKQVFELAVLKLNKGRPPCSFCWFVTGSSGRFEQGLISDQDHGIIYEIFTDENEAYFLELGKEIAYGLNIVGYPYCQGNVMSSNPVWCKSLNNWQKQLHTWMADGSWESIRNMHIFFDARSLVGDYNYIAILKKAVFTYQIQLPDFMTRLVKNVAHIKKAIGPLGQILIEEKGEHYGSIDLKYSAFIPYVNSIRVLAFKEGLLETSTIDRISHLAERAAYKEMMKEISVNFQHLLSMRITLLNADSYDDTHYLNIKQWPPSERKMLKKILKDGEKLHYYVQSFLKRV